MIDRIIFDPSDSERPDLQVMADVISLAEVRVARGWTRGKVCEHRSLVYSSKERRIECKDCDQPVDGFDAFMTLCRHFDAMEKAAKNREHKTKAGLEAVIVRRAAKEIDRTWGRKMAPQCPHCRRGLLPEDFANGAAGCVGGEWEAARREKDRT